MFIFFFIEVYKVDFWVLMIDILLFLFALLLEKNPVKVCWGKFLCFFSLIILRGPLFRTKAVDLDFDSTR